MRLKGFIPRSRGVPKGALQESRFRVLFFFFFAGGQCVLNIESIGGKPDQGLGGGR